MAVVLFSCSAWATPILLGEAAKKTLGNVGDSTIRDWLKDLLTDYNSLHKTTLPVDVVGASPDVKVDSGSGPLRITLPVGAYDYLVIHWGGQHGGVVEAYDLIGNTGNYTFQSPANGLSFYSFYGRESSAVPEPSTMFLLGSGMVGVVALRRKFKKQQ